jgi:putative hemolysin
MKKLKVFLMILVVLGLASCANGKPEVDDAPNIPNPASVYCEQNGGRLDFREDVEGGDNGYCLFTDGSECEEWAYFRGECVPASQERDTDATGDGAPTAPVESDPTPVFSADETQGWWAYQNTDYGFSIMLPEDWVAEETSTSDPLMNGHFLMLHPRIETGTDLNIRMAFRRKGEDTLLWPTGVGDGEFVADGTLEVSGQIVRRILFKCPSGVIGDIRYHGPEETGPNIQIGEFEFGFISSYTGVYCQEGFSLEGKLARLSDLIVSSLTLP